MTTLKELMNNIENKEWVEKALCYTCGKEKIKFCYNTIMVCGKCLIKIDNEEKRKTVDEMKKLKGVYQ